MASRIRSSPNHVFDVFMEISQPGDDVNSKPVILQQYPHNFKDEEIIKSVPQFCYPCKFDCPNVLHFSFVLTSIDSKWSFGFIRHPPQPGDTCLLLLSSLPWHDTFYKLLNYIAGLIAKDNAAHLNRFLEALYLIPVPQPGLFLQVIYAVNNREYEFTAQCPDHHKIPSIPEDRNLSEYFNAVDVNNMIMIFASMLNERRILISSKKLSRLSACAQAANSLIYPMYWQHIFIPVLPSHLLDYLSAPMPFLIGVPSSTLATVKHGEFGEIVVLDADENKITSPFDDVGMLPNEIVSFLKKSLRNNGSLIGDGVARTFLKALVMLIGGYQNALRFPSGGKISFDKEAFVRTRPDHMQPFLQKMLHLQIFHQFIEDRIRMLTNGENLSDEFEFEVNMYEEEQSSNRFRTQYREWLGQMKKEGGALLKSVNPAVKSAYKQVKNRGKKVKDRSKKAYHGFKLKLQDIQKPEPGLPRSAPSTPRESPTSSSSYGNDEGSAGISVRKSASGIVHGRQGRTTFAVSSSELNSKRGLFNDLSRHDPFAKDNSSEQAPEASSEDSEIDLADDDGLFDSEEFKYEPINIDLMGELREVIANFGLQNDLDETLTSARLDNETAKSEEPWESSQKLSLSASRKEPFNLPLPPPRSSNSRRQSDTSSETKQEDLLITLDSSPDDLETIFDPLKQKQTKQQQSTTQSSGLFGHNPMSTTNHMSSASAKIESFLHGSTSAKLSLQDLTPTPQLPPKPQNSFYQFSSNQSNHIDQPLQSFLSQAPLSSTALSSTSSATATHSDHIKKTLFTEPNEYIRNHSFLHSFNQNSFANGALNPSNITYNSNSPVVQPTTMNSLSTTSPFTVNNPINFTSCGKSSTNSFLHPTNRDGIVNNEKSSFQSNWQKFE